MPLPKVDFKECPMYNKAYENKQDIDALHSGHRTIVEELKVMAHNQDKLFKYHNKRHKNLKKHMEEESVYHVKSHEFMERLEETQGKQTDALTLLLEDKRSRDIDAEVTEQLKIKEEPRNTIKRRIILVVVTMVTGATLTAMGSGVLFIYNLYLKFEGQ